MNIYCYKGRDKELSVLLQSITLNIDIESDDFNCFSGNSPEEVETAHRSHKSIFSFSLLSSRKKKAMNLNPFNTTCIGLETAEEYKVSLKLIRTDLLKLAMLAMGLVLFFKASSISRNNFFFYISGIGLGNCASLLVLIWFVSKLIPRVRLSNASLHSFT